MSLCQTCSIPQNFNSRRVSVLAGPKSIKKGQFVCLSLGFLTLLKNVLQTTRNKIRKFNHGCQPLSHIEDGTQRCSAHIGDALIVTFFVLDVCALWFTHSIVNSRLNGQLSIQIFCHMFLSKNILLKF